MALSQERTNEAAYLVERRTGDEPETEAIGRLALDVDHKLEVVDADEAYADVLQEIVSAINALPSLSVKVPVADSEWHGIRFEAATRADPGFPSLLQAYFDQQYDLALVPPDETIEDES